MEEATFDRFPEARSDAPELTLFRRLAGLESRNRLEQERIPAWWAAERLAAAVSRPAR